MNWLRQGITWKIILNLAKRKEFNIVSYKNNYILKSIGTIFYNFCSYNMHIQNERNDLENMYCDKNEYSFLFTTYRYVQKLVIL